MACISTVDSESIHYRANHYSFDVLSNRTQIEHVFSQDLDRSGFTREQFIGKKLLLDFSSEGQQWQEINQLVQYLQETGIQSIGVLFSTIQQNPTVDYRYIGMPETMADHCNWFATLRTANIDWEQVVLDKKFLCLNRRPKQIRALLVESLLKTVGTDNARMSYAVAENLHEIKQQLWINGVADEQSQHNMTDGQFHSCLYNVIAETSDQSQSNSWKSIFITEKTFKCFALHQVPVWMAVPGLVDCVRKLGFDVFDDLCDEHKYDTIQNEQRRCTKVINLVTRLNQQSLIQCQSLRSQIWDRLHANYLHLENMVNNYPAQLQSAHQYLFYQIN